MNHDSLKYDTWPDRRSVLQHNALVDAARQRALELRTEAIDAFWSGIARSARRALHALRRDSAPIAQATVASPCPR